MCVIQLPWYILFIMALLITKNSTLIEMPPTPPLSSTTLISSYSGSENRSEITTAKSSSFALIIYESHRPYGEGRRKVYTKR